MSPTSSSYQEAGELLCRMVAVVRRNPVSAMPIDFATVDVPSLKYAEGVYLEQAEGGWEARIEFLLPDGARPSIQMGELQSEKMAFDKAQSALATIYEREKQVVRRIPTGSQVFDLAGNTILVSARDIDKVLAEARINGGLPSASEIGVGLDRFLEAARNDGVRNVLRTSPETVRTITLAVASGLTAWPVAVGYSAYVH